MKIISSPGDYCFIGNSVQFKFEVESASPIQFDVVALGETISLSGYPYKNGNSYAMDLPIGDILSAFFNMDYSVNDTDLLVSAVTDFVMEYFLIVDSEIIHTGKALKGGVSKAIIKLLDQNNYDIFTYKILNSFGQFLFTTRTFGKQILIRDTELHNFLFFHPGTTIAVTNEKDYEIVIEENYKQFTSCSLNLEAIYNRYILLTESAPSTVNVHVDGVKTFSFKIIPGTISEYQYAIRFRDSFGVFEKVEVTGKPYQKPEFSEEKSYQELTKYGTFEDRRSRVEHRDVIEVETGYKTRSEHSFIIDLVKSNEMYFIDKDGIEKRCSVSADDLKFEERLIQPSSIKLKVALVDLEEFAGTGFDLNDLLEGRIFTENFDEPFN